MPSPYRRSLPRLKAEIVGRVLAGEALRAICWAAGMPDRDTVRRWAKADALFAGDLVAARRRAGWMRLYAYDEGRAEAFLARARAGEPIRRLLREPGGLSQASYRYWKATQPAFAEALFALRRRGDAAFLAGGRAVAAARRRDFDPALADRVIVALHRTTRPGFVGDGRLEAVLAADPELPCRPVLARWRREEPEFDRVLRMIFAARLTLGPRVDELLVEDIADHIVDGGSFASYCRAGGPSRGTLRRWYRADGGFARAVDAACERREEMLDFELWLAAERVPPGPVREMTRAVAPITRAIVRLRHRPGAAHRRRAGRGASPLVGEGGPEGVG
jgi:hypothetical protein